MALSKKKEKEKDKNKASSRSRLFGRKGTKREPPPKRPIQNPATPSPTVLQSSGNSTHAPAPSNSVSFGEVASPLRADAMTSLRLNRLNRASILLTADEFDALANTNYANSFSPTLSSRIPPPNHSALNRKRDLSVVASDMSSTTRRDSQKQIFWNSLRTDPEEPPNKKELKKLKRERKTQMRKSKVKKQKSRELKVKPLDAMASMENKLTNSRDRVEPDSPVQSSFSNPILTPAISMMIATVPRSVRPERPSPPILPPPTKLVFSPRAIDFVPSPTTGWNLKTSAESEFGRGFGAWTRPRDKIVEAEVKKPATITGTLQLGQRSRLSVSSPRQLTRGEETSAERVPIQKSPDIQQQWQQFQNRQQRKVWDKPPPAQVAAPLAVHLPTSNPLPAHSPPQESVKPYEESRPNTDTSNFFSTSSSEEEEEFGGELTYRSQKLAFMAHEIDISALSALSPGNDDYETSSYSSTGSYSSDEREPAAGRHPTRVHKEASAELDGYINTLENLGRGLTSSPSLTSPKSPPEARRGSFSSTEETSSSGDDLSSLSTAVGGINIDFNFSTSLRASMKGKVSSSGSGSYSSDSYSSDTPSDDGNGYSLSDLKGLAGDVSFDISTSESSDEDSSEDSDSYNHEEERVQVIPRPGVEVVLGEKLGKGATATVWSGSYDGKPVAVKQITLKAFKEGEKHAQAAVKREYDTVRAIDHTSIIRYYGIFYNKTDQEVNIVMELIRGVSLTDLVIFQDGLSEAHSSFLLKHIMTALSFLHDQCHLIHRDVKPDNILLDTRAKIKIIDFGTATCVDPNNAIKRRSTVGTPWYCAPEIVNDEEYIYRVDIWSIGCMSIELVTGEPPFCNLNDIECLFKMSEKEPPPLPEDVSGKCRDFLSRCLEPEWRTRPTAAELLSHPFLIMSEAQERARWSELKAIVRKMSAARERAQSISGNH